jgi:MFS transporter, NNP family, nitrate/nitrite transporter
MKINFPFFSREPRIRILHFSWLAFFVSFIVWFNHAPLMAAIKETFQLSKEQVAALLILNVALAIPARIGVGILVDKLGPRLMYTILLCVSGIICLFFAFAQSFATLAVARFLLGFVGAGFVVGIRIISEWFPARESGLAQGLYAGLGNFGSAAAAVTLPAIAMLYGGPEGWRWAIATTGVIALVYSAVYYLNVTDAPKGSTYFSPKKMGAMEVTSKKDFFLYCITQAPIAAALAFIAWKLGQSNLKMLPQVAEIACYAGAIALYAMQLFDTWRINKGIFEKPVDAVQRYRFTQVAVLNVSYFMTFGSELAVVSILPLLFKDMFDLSLAVAGFVGASFGMTAFFARPIGGWLSDCFGRRRTLATLLAGTALGYFGMSQMSLALGVVFAVVVTVFCSLFVNAANGAVYAMLPMIKRRLTGQIAGMVGAFGNVGGVAFLAIFASFDATTLFLFAGLGSALSFVLVLAFIADPKGHIAEEMPDGTLALIEVT